MADWTSVVRVSKDGVDALAGKKDEEPVGGIKLESKPAPVGLLNTAKKY